MNNFSTATVSADLYINMRCLVNLGSNTLNRQTEFNFNEIYAKYGQLKTNLPIGSCLIQYVSRSFQLLGLHIPLSILKV